MVYSLAGIMQVGLGASVIEASPLHNDDAQQIVQLDRHYGDYRHQGDHERRRHEENRRHERAMQRHYRENDRDWNNRQWRENQRHDNTMNEIAAGIIGIVIGSQL